MNAPMPQGTPPLDWPDYNIGFVDAYKRVFQKYATFDGRASRAEFWWWTLANFVVVLVLYALVFAFAFSGDGSGSGMSVIGGIFGILLLIYALAVIVPSIAVTVRRLHDAGYSGWFYLVTFIPFVGGIALIVLCAMETSPKAAQYGPPAPEGYVPPQAMYG
ncbi:MAG: DUF805 domain-containing protein, partial [Gordonia sp. (in: high G+C Gram-positive bacteria)]|uniref:DUF805 domain-containing protein n=1 Tax=Gordonia sp. (in: high G+C Gram-positive bacteria) TaxID=84139 RepID=UPI003BB7C8AA